VIGRTPPPPAATPPGSITQRLARDIEAHFQAPREVPVGVAVSGVVRWPFFLDATLRVAADVIARDGKLQ
jgi:hypothetical protein